MNEAKRGKSIWQLGSRHVLVVVFFVGIFTLSACETTDPDMWWHLATGQYIIETHSIPQHDIFSYTATEHEWITHEWLTQVGMISLYNVGGLSALLLATSVVITLSFALVYLQCDARPHLAVFGVLFGALASAMTWGARPQMLNILMAALFTYLLYLFRTKNKRILWLFPILTALWVNLHSGYFLGIVIMGIVVVGNLIANFLEHQTPRTLSLKQVRNLLIALGVSVMAVLLNPNGYKMFLYPFQTLGSRAMQQYIQEWAPPNLHLLQYWPLAALLFGGASLLIFSRRKRDLTDILLFFGFAFAALLSARHIPLFVVVAVPILTHYATQVKVGRLSWDLTNLPRPRAPSRPLVILNWFLVVVFVLAGSLRVENVVSKNQDIEARQYPQQALEYIEANNLAAKRMYNLYHWGGYLLWRGYKVFIDGRADVYLDDFINEYMEAFQVHEDWRRPLDKYAVDYVLIESSDSLAALLEASGEWSRAYRDDMAVIFVRAEDG
jgi:hypothetical protein